LPDEFALLPLIHKRRMLQDCVSCGKPYIVGSSWRCKSCTELLIPCDVCHFYLAPDHFDGFLTTCRVCYDWESRDHPEVDFHYWMEHMDEWIRDANTKTAYRDILNKIYYEIVTKESDA